VPGEPRRQAARREHARHGVGGRPIATPRAAREDAIGDDREVIRGDQRALRRIQQHSEAMSRTQPHTHLLRREHRHSEALRGTQEAIKWQSSGKRHSPAQVRARALRSLLAAPPEQPTAAATSTHRQSYSGARVATRRGKRGRALPVGRRGRRGEHLHAGSLCGSSRKQGTRAFPHRPGHQWSSVVISGHQWSSVVISGHQWSSVVIRLRALPLRPLCARRAPPRAAWVARTR
jgi:hypothetical protein